MSLEEAAGLGGAGLYENIASFLAVKRRNGKHTFLFYQVLHQPIPPQPCFLETLRCFQILVSGSGHRESLATCEPDTLASRTVPDSNGKLFLP